MAGFGAATLATTVLGAPSASADGGRSYSAGHFALALDGHEVAVFEDVQGLAAALQPNRMRPITLVLKRGRSSSMEMWAWHEAVMTGDIGAARRGCDVFLCGENSPVMHYHLENAWPRIEGAGALKPNGGEVAMETVTIICERIQRVSV
jgi:hypothetical protein